MHEEPLSDADLQRLQKLLRLTRPQVEMARDAQDRVRALRTAGGDAAVQEYIAERQRTNQELQRSNLATMRELRDRAQARSDPDPSVLASYTRLIERAERSLAASMKEPCSSHRSYVDDCLMCQAG